MVFVISEPRKEIIRKGKFEKVNSCFITVRFLNIVFARMLVVLQIGIGNRRTDWKLKIGNKVLFWQ